MLSLLKNRRGWVLVRASLKRMGPRRTFLRVVHKVGRSGDSDYHRSVLEAHSRASIELPLVDRKDSVSIIVPCLNTPVDAFSRMVDSVRRQTDPNWELIIVDDGSINCAHLAFLNASLRDTERISVILRESTEGISLATNTGIAAALGGYIAFLDHDDELSPHAIRRVRECVSACGPALIYTDEDKISYSGYYEEPFYKPDWSPELLDSCNYITHFCVVRRDVGQKIGWFREGYDGSQDYDLVLRISENTADIRHIPEVLYHWRKVSGSTSDTSLAKPYAVEAGFRAISESFRRRGRSERVRSIEFLPGHYTTASDSSLAGFPTVEVICHGSHPKISLQNGWRLTLIEDHESEEGIGARIAECASSWTSGLVLFLSAPKRHFLDDCALHRMMCLATRKGVAIVGATVLDSPRRIHSSGYCKAEAGLRAYGRGRHPSEMGYFGSLVDNRNVTSVGAELWIGRVELLKPILTGYTPAVAACSFQNWVHKLCSDVLWSSGRVVVCSSVSYGPRSLYSSDAIVTLPDLNLGMPWSEGAYGLVSSMREAVSV